MTPLTVILARSFRLPALTGVASRHIAAVAAILAVLTIGRKIPQPVVAPPTP